jgi:hypothetical protein
MKTYRGVDVYIHVFFTSTLVEGAVPHEKLIISQVFLFKLLALV